MLFVKPVLAVCPVCFIAAGSALGLAELLGVDDLIASLWIGAVITSAAFWMGDKFKLVKLPRPTLIWPLIFYLLTIGGLYSQGKIGLANCRIFGVDKVLLGITLGTALFGVGVLLDRWLRTQNKGKVFVPFQKVILPLLLVGLANLFFSLTCLS